MNKGAIYCRVSSDRQREKSTIQSQKDILPKLAADKGYSVVATYVDDGISGETIEDRPAFKKLLQEADEKHFDAVFVIDYDRLSRASDILQIGLIKNIFRENGIKVVTPSQVYDFRDEEHDFMANLMGILAAREKRKIIARTRRGKLSKWQRGQHASGIVPFGYRWAEKAYEIVPEEARIVRFIYDLALIGTGSESIAMELNARGEPTPTELRPTQRRKRTRQGWAKTSVRRILSQETYCGDRYVGVLEKVGKNLVSKPRSEWIRVPVPPIVTRAEFDQVRQLAQRNRTFSVSERRPYLLSHLLKCEECGKSLVGEKVHGRGYYICFKRRKPKYYGATCILPWQPQKALEAAVWSAVVRLVDDPGFLKAEIRRHFEESIRRADTGLNREHIEKLLQAKQVERERVLGLFRRGRIDTGALDREFGKIESEESILNRNLSLIENREKIERSLNRNLDQLGAKLAQIQERIHHLDFSEKRKILEMLGYDGKPRISVSKNGEIVFDGLMNFENADWLLEKVTSISNI